MPEPTDIAGLSVLAAITVIGCYLDIKYRRLPNWLCLAAAAGGLVYVLLSADLHAAIMAAAHGAAALVLGMVIFKFGMFGGGDAKFYGGLACWIPISKGFSLLALASVCTLVFVLVWFVASAGKQNKDAGGGGKKAMLPFGVPISIASWITVYLLSAG